MTARSKLTYLGYAIVTSVVLGATLQAWNNIEEIPGWLRYIATLFVVIVIRSRFGTVTTIATEAFSRVTNPKTLRRVQALMYMAWATATGLPLTVLVVSWTDPVYTNFDSLLAPLGCLVAFVITQVIVDVIDATPSESPPKE